MRRPQVLKPTNPLFELLFPFICNFILVHLNYFEPARKALAMSRLQRGPEWHDQTPLWNQKFLDTLYHPALMEDFYSDEEARRTQELEDLLRDFDGPYETWPHSAELGRLREQGYRRFEAAFLKRVDSDSGELLPPLLDPDQRTSLYYNNQANLTSETSNPEPLCELCLEDDSVFPALTALLFNVDVEKFYLGLNSQNLSDFYLNWLETLSAENLCLLRTGLDHSQRIKLDWYLKELEYRKAKSSLVKWLCEYQGSIGNEEKKAKPEEQSYYRAAASCTASLLKILNGVGEYQGVDYEHRVRTFFVEYAEKKLVLSDPYTKKLKSNLEKLWNWLRKKFGWAPAHRKLERSISSNPHALFKQEKTVYLLLRLVKEFVDGFRGDCRVVRHFTDLRNFLKDINKTSEEKVASFKDFLRVNEELLKKGEFNQEFVAVAKEILAGMPASLAQPVPS